MGSIWPATLHAGQKINSGSNQRPAGIHGPGHEKISGVPGQFACPAAASSDRKRSRGKTSDRRPTGNLKLDAAASRRHLARFPGRVTAGHRDLVAPREQKSDDRTDAQRDAGCMVGVSSDDPVGCLGAIFRL